jgi:hypothetical protein
MRVVSVNVGRVDLDALPINGRRYFAKRFAGVSTTTAN